MSLSDCIFIPTDEDEEYVDALADALEYYLNSFTTVILYTLNISRYEVQN